MKHIITRDHSRIICSICTILLFGFSAYKQVGITHAQGDKPTRRVNVPYLGAVPPAQYFTPSIFWFGKVNSTNNYADVRIYYYDDYLKVVVHIIDRWLMYDTTPTFSELTQWDSVSLYLNRDGNLGSAPGSEAFRFDAQVNWYESPEQWQAAYRGNGSGWSMEAIPFATETGWRGDGVLNDNLDDKGWNVAFIIPFSSLGLSEKPPQGTLWGAAIIVHDRDDATGTPIPDTVWPEDMSSSVPATWGQMVFGLPQYTPTDLVPWGSTTIRQGLNGVTVTDAHVGGHTTCGENLDHWTEWGEANYAGYTQINIQNQWDISDWPCFSKYFVTFPLGSLPADKTVFSATLTMYQFGNSWGEGIEPSYIQVLTVAEDWDEATLTWNNAPLAVENISGTWVEPIAFPGWPGVPRTWDVSRAVAQAYAVGEPLRLVLYSADGAYHSGRYFSSSDTGDWNAEARPTLKVIWGIPRDSGDLHFIFLPAIIRR